MAAQSNIMKDSPYRIALYCLYSITLKEIAMNKSVHKSKQTDVETPGTSMDHLPPLLQRATKICLSNKNCKSNGGPPLCNVHASNLQTASSLQKTQHIFKNHVCVLPNMFLNSLPILTVDHSQTGDIFHYAL